MATATSPNTLPIADIHLPGTVSAWPPAIGWWLLALLLIALFIGASMVIKRYRKKWGYRNAALRLLEQQTKTYSEGEITPSATSAYTQALLGLLKRTAVTAYPQHNIAALFGQDWINALNQQTKKPYFNSTLATFLVNQQYQASKAYNEDTVSALNKACKAWIKHHNTHYTPRGAHTC